MASLSIANRPDLNSRTKTTASAVRFSFIPLAALLYSTLLPAEVRLHVSSLELYAYRLVVFAALPFFVLHVWRKPLRMRWPDWMVLLSGVWIVLAITAVHGLGRLQSGGAIALDLVAPYFLARITIEDTRDLRRVLVIFLPGLIAVAAIMMVESVTHQIILRPIAASIFGSLDAFTTAGSSVLGYEIRLGLLRSSGPFPHPILAGLYMSSMLCLFYYAGLKKWQQAAGICIAFAGIFGVSSSAFIGIGLSFAVIAYDRLQKEFEILSWKRLFLVAGTIVILMQMFVGGGVVGFTVRHFTLNPATGYYRTMIWDYGTKSVMSHPLFGIGMNEFERGRGMSGSVDAYWLVLAMKYGLPVCLMLLAAVFGAVFMAAKNAYEPTRTARDPRKGVAISLGIIAVLAITVHLFGSMQIWFCILLAMAVSLAYAPRHIQRQPAPLKRRKAVPRYGRAEPNRRGPPIPITPFKS